MERLPAVFLDGLIFAAWLFLVSAGLTFVYGVLRVLNVAHGSFYSLGAYLAATLVGAIVGRGLSVLLTYPALLAAALVVGLAVGPLMERVLLRRIQGRDEVTGLLLTFAVLLIFEDVTKLIWGVTPWSADAAYGALGQVRLGTVTYAVYPLALVGVGAAVGAGLWALVNRTPFGKLVSSVIADREVSAALGVDVGRINSFAFTLGAILAALGGALVAPMISVVPGISVEVIIVAFAVTVIGGLGNIAGAALGAVAVGLIRAAALYFFPELDLFLVYAIMTLVLIFRPYGLFGRPEVRRI
jgi:branched-chain amino acid transport system permease protein